MVKSNLYLILRHDFTKHVKQVPPPTKYDIKSFAEENIEHKKGI